MQDYLVVADLDAGEQWARIFLAAPIVLQDIEEHCGDQLHEERRVQWDPAQQVVRARIQQRLGALILRDRPIQQPDRDLIRAGLIDGLRQVGIAALPWTKGLRQWQARVALLRRIEPMPGKLTATTVWPDVSDQALLDRLGEWLGPFLDGLTRLDQVQRLDLTEPLHNLLTWEQRRDLDRLAPTHLSVPSGSRVRLNYETDDRPVLAVRLQEMFGCRETPRIADGKVAVIIHLLSPAGRPVQVTQDLRSFWSSGYQEVRKELRGRYPKHHWPEDPQSAEPTARAKRRTPSQ
jgi:ATP-dependent helicase HrpB